MKYGQNYCYDIWRLILFHIDYFLIEDENNLRNFRLVCKLFSQIMEKHPYWIQKLQNCLWIPLFKLQLTKENKHKINDLGFSLYSLHRQIFTISIMTLYKCDKFPIYIHVNKKLYSFSEQMIDSFPSFIIDYINNQNIVLLFDH